MQKFNTASNPITVLIFLPVRAAVSMLCSNQTPFSQGDEIPGLPKGTTNKASGFFNKIVLGGGGCLFILLFSFLLDHSSKQVVLVSAVTECRMQTLLKAKKKPQTLHNIAYHYFGAVTKQIAK